MSFSLFVCGFLFVIYKGLLDEKAWKMVGSASTILSVGSRITQIIKSCKEKSTGPLSTITFLLNMAGNVARIFTTMKETQDIIMAGGFVISFVLKTFNNKYNLFCDKEHNYKERAKVCSNHDGPQTGLNLIVDYKNKFQEIKLKYQKKG